MVQIKPGNRSRQGFLPVLLLIPVLAAASAPPAAGQPVSVEAQTVAGAKVVPQVFEGDVRDLPQVAARREYHSWEPQEPPSFKPPAPERAGVEPNLSLAPMPALSQNFAGLSFNTLVTGGQAGAGWPPDVNGDVGPTTTSRR